MPSTTSSSFSRLLPSSTVMTPSLPTLSIASAMILPIDSSLLAEMEPTCAISLEVVVGLEALRSCSVSCSTALSMPRLRSIGFMPAATYFMPSRTMAWASTVAVVVPSPALSLVLEATSLTICAPMFCSLSFSSISLATDTPSLVTVGAPKERSSTTLRPLGPRVTLTALARMFTPSTMRWRASAPKITSLAAIDSYLFEMFGGGRRRLRDLLEAGGGSALDHGEQVVFLHDQQLVAVDLDGLAGVLAEQDAVADLDVQRDELALVVLAAGADGQDFTLVRLFGGVVGDDDAGRRLGFLFQALDDHTVVQRTKFHCISFNECRGHQKAPTKVSAHELSWRAPAARLLALSPNEC